MTSGIARWSGWAGMVAAVTYLLAGILILAAPPQRRFDSFSYYLSEIVLVVAFTATLVVVSGLPGSHRRRRARVRAGAVPATLVVVSGLHGSQRGRYGRSGAAGSLIAFIGYALIALVT